ncbi:isoleucyl-tRNA synthetase [Campylobacter sp. RM13119]|uniref:Isoleucyl-tRNA synthetase n=1 Tax=Campylobacter californiensis TaxID=1032243 RepID=A0ABD4JH42_9BACT|nr:MULTISPECIES: isoleucyl-tRNA synthetase [unclassified Campylobacter]MBE2985869.1 isoleucyl-tRNA synthetase [Campylobacter sp. RM12919]MBE2988946.1 isoleucyl-tRNA synthetase [Campylobacter sp. RM12920]MBE3022971.1 isoleucyl-tRNA synthetase [Campylobacter sp. 7477a]MBE3606423.1 isoleucyl-tRNA synthetase [Campylobacter sp. RM13119]MBE3609556.1 isoleucyl-tRNA synthetase [Campylobacter sp. RM12916]
MKIINSFFVGFLFVLAPIFTLFAGLKVNYFDHYGIDEYFNAIFIHNVPILWLAPLYLFVGYAFFYSKFRKFFRAFYVIVLLFSLLSWLPAIGLNVGERIFAEPDYDEFIQDSDSGVKTVNFRPLYKTKDTIYVIKNKGDYAVKIKRNK